MKRPWFKFYTSDWRGDPKLRFCSLAARGLWVEMISIMHESEPYGHLIIGKNLLGIDDFKAIAMQVGCPAKEAKKLLSELHIQGVLSIKNDGAIFCRRMVRDDEKANKDKENGSKGGNPKLIGGVNPRLNLSDKENYDEGVNPRDNGEDKAQIPDTIYQSQSQRPEGQIGAPPGGVAPLPESGEGAKKNAPVVPPLPDDVSFGDIEADVSRYIANAAAENKSGKITPSRIASLRRELFLAIERTGSREAFAFGLRAANNAGAANANYVLKAAKNHGKADVATAPFERPARRMGTVLPD